MTSNTNKIRTYYLLSVLFMCCRLHLISAQADDDDILDAFDYYTEAPREVAYVHLNKSTYIQGEFLAFKAYVFDKYSKEISDATTNLYTTVSDTQGNIIKKKLIRIEDGVGSNVFELDDSLSTGTYVFKAYTNWMKNFTENNHFEQSFKVIEGENGEDIKPVVMSKEDIDVQVLGEGGHILADVTNTIGIIAKNKLGYGVSFARGEIVDNNNAVIADFTLNKMGLAKALFMPKSNNQYYLNLSIGDQVIRQKIAPIDKVGITLNSNIVGDEVLLEVLTNSASSSLFKNKVLKAAIHDGSSIDIIKFSLSDKGRSVLKLDKKQLFPGANIITIFNDKNQPLLERIIFNSNELPIEKLSLGKINRKEDSLGIQLSTRVKNSDKNSLSISVLPTGTKSYNHNESIISKLYLQPFIKSPIQNSAQYFKNLDAESQYQLDLVLLTQGWSSYDWNEIFIYDNVYKYPFERGIDVVANINKNQKGTYIFHPLLDSDTQIFDIPESEKSFTIKTVFPQEDDLFRISYVGKNKKGSKKTPNLFLQFFPAKFAELNYSSPIITEAFTESILTSDIPEITRLGEEVEKLDEVVVRGIAARTKSEELQNKAITSRVKIIEERDTWGSMRLDLYLQRIGWNTQFDYFSGTLSITNPRTRWKNPIPLVYLDDGLLNMGGAGSADFSVLTFLTMEFIDYIEYDFYGVGQGLMGGQAGFIKIYTKPNASVRNIPETSKVYDVPLRFSDDKKFYTPKYQIYNSKFYYEYGTVAWFDNLQFDSNGQLQFNIPNYANNDLDIYVEGIIGDGTLISQKLELTTE